MILLQGTLALTRQESWLAGKIIGRAWGRRSSFMFEDATCVWLRRQSNMSFMVIYRPYLYQLIGRKTLLWTLWPDCRFSLTRKMTAITPFSLLSTGWPRWCTQTSQSHHQCSKTSESNHRHGGTTSRPPRLYHKRPRSDFYVQVLVFALLLPWHQATTVHCIPPSDQRKDETPKQHDKSIPLCLCKLGAE